MLDFSKFQYLTFDCYGTLIDWEAGILSAVLSVLKNHKLTVTNDEILATYAELESAAEQAEYMPYRQVLRLVMRGLGEAFGFTPDDRELHALENSLPSWPAFPDTVDSLQRLAARYELCIVSNTDDDLFAETEYTLTGGAAAEHSFSFAHVITAEQCRSYKPSLTNFATALERIGTGTSKVLHVAQSLHHDIAPARSIGLSTVWVNRRKGKAGTGATKAATAVPDLEVPDLKTLSELAI